MTGPSPVDRGKPGSKIHTVTDRQGTPLAVRISAANTPDGDVILHLLDQIPAVRGKPGRPRRRPGKVHADKAYHARWIRRGLRRRGISPRIARPGIESSQRLGKHRWVVERTIEWISRYRRLVRRYDRKPEHFQAFATIACLLICHRRYTAN